MIVQFVSYTNGSVIKTVMHDNYVPYMYTQWLCSQVRLYTYQVCIFIDEIIIVCIVILGSCNRLLDVINAPTYFTDGGAVKVLLSAFRELCGLLWFLHVRDQLSKYLRLLQPSPLKVSNFSQHSPSNTYWCKYTVPCPMLALRPYQLFCKTCTSVSLCPIPMIVLIVLFLRPCLYSVISICDK